LSKKKKRQKKEGERLKKKEKKKKKKKKKIVIQANVCRAQPIVMILRLPVEKIPSHPKVAVLEIETYTENEPE